MDAKQAEALQRIAYELDSISTKLNNLCCEIADIAKSVAKVEQMGDVPEGAILQAWRLSGDASHEVFSARNQLRQVLQQETR